MAGANRFSDIVLVALQFLDKDCLRLHPWQQEVLLQILSERDTFITHVGHVHYVNNVASVRPILPFVFQLISYTGSAGSQLDKYEK